MDLNKLYRSMFTDSDDDLIKKIIDYEDYHDEYDPDDYYYEKPSSYLLREDDDALRYDMVSKYKLTLLLAAHARRYKAVKILLDYDYSKPNCADTSTMMAPLHVITSMSNIEYLSLDLFNMIDQEDVELIRDYVDSANEMGLNKSVIISITRKVLSGSKNLTAEDIKILADEINKEELEIAKLLLKEGADVNKRDVYKSSPLHRAANSGKKDMIRLLIDYGADINALDMFGNSPLDNAVQHSESTELIISHIVLQCFNHFSQDHKHINFEICMKTIDQTDRLKSFKKDCEKELDMLKSIQLNSKYNLLVFLYRDTNFLARLIKNPAVKAFNVHEFKIYGEKVQQAIKLASKRLNIIESSIPKIDEVLNDSHWTSVPTEIRYSILELLKDKDLLVINNS
ncbi:SWPV1-017 [Shearwaterpox virus]|uniref:SWPV1-017 n=1 Tax=Shearwaterpox virus TaxID=1974596 RepID=A0A1V0S7N0_CNPV|nr:SWPV1-017 [Shearwaterpox virus]